MKHLEDEDIGRLLDGTVSKQERHQFLLHLSQCKTCLTLYSETLKFMDEGDNAKSKSLLTFPVPRKITLTGLRQAIGSIFTIRRSGWVFAVILIILVMGYFLVQRNNKAKWLDRFKNYAQTTEGKKDRRVIWANQVFERVKVVADKAEARFPYLYIIDSRAEIYALSVPDGGIIINPVTLDICYGGSTREEGNRRLAFILGHELAHLANKNYIHQEAFAALQEQGDRKAQEVLTRYFKLTDPGKIKALRKREVLADQKGVMYACMAGYDVGQLFREGNDFFTYWAQQTGVSMLYDDPTESHPSLQQRLQFIRAQLQTVVDHLELFRAGVLLFQVEDYHDAAAAFRGFAKYYPAREVLNNWGACYMNLALYRLHLYFGDDYYRFRLSTAIDYTTTAFRMKARGEGDYLEKDKEIAEYIDKAVKCFEQAVEMDRGNCTASCNLAAAYILRKEYAGALAVCETILKQYPQEVEILNNQAIAFYYQGKREGFDTIPKAIQILESALKSEPENPEVLYNLASIREQQNRKAEAKRDWENYLKLKTVPKDNFYIYVYTKMNGKEPFIPATKAEAPPIPGGIRLGEDFSLLEQKWGKTYTQEFTIWEEEVHKDWDIDLKVMVKEGVRVVAISEIGIKVKVVEQECPTGESISEITARYGKPQQVVRHTGGHFYVYQDRGFSVKEVGGQVCSYIWYEKGGGDSTP